MISTQHSTQHNTTQHNLVHFNITTIYDTTNLPNYTNIYQPASHPSTSTPHNPNTFPPFSRLPHINSGPAGVGKPHRMGSMSSGSIRTRGRTPTCPIRSRRSSKPRFLNRFPTRHVAPRYPGKDSTRTLPFHFPRKITYLEAKIINFW